MERSGFGVNESFCALAKLLFRPFCFLIIVSVCFASVATPTSSAGDQNIRPGEYELKAVYLYNFLNFVHWPEAQSDSAREPLANVIGIVGESPFGDALFALRDKISKTKNNGFSIVHYGKFKEGMDLAGCRLLFVAESEKENFGRIEASLGDLPVLTISDADDFLDAGGMISLVLHGNKVRWEINRVKIEASGMRVSAKLLEIALRVVSNSGPGGQK